MPTNDKKKREEAFTRICDLLRPYQARVTAEWTDKQNNSVYVFLVCSKEADAGDDRHTWRGSVTVNITSDGSTHVSYSEGLVGHLLERPQTGTWEDTANALAVLVPPLVALPTDASELAALAAQRRAKHMHQATPHLYAALKALLASGDDVTRAAAIAALRLADSGG